MAIVTVNLLDTFDQWRLKTNDLGTNQGDLVTLNTTDKSSVVSAINEISSGLSSLSGSALKNIVEDTTPQLGGNLDLNNLDITGTGNLNISGSITATTIAGTVSGVTQSPNDNSTKLATTEYVDSQVATENTLVEMDDTLITNPADQDVIRYNNSTQLWENISLSGFGVLTELIQDTSPQLGGNLDLNGFDIDGNGNININGTITATNIVGNTGATELLTDLTPQLGGNLDLNSSDVTGIGNINITGTINCTSIDGSVTGVTQSAGDNSTKFATTEYADTAATNAAGSVSGFATEEFAVGIAIALG